MAGRMQVLGHGRSDDEFCLELPLRRAGAQWFTATHVVELRGDRQRFWAQLTEVMAATADVCVVLTSPVSSLGAVADALNAIGEASVLSIDVLAQTATH